MSQRYLPYLIASILSCIGIIPFSLAAQSDCDSLSAILVTTHVSCAGEADGVISVIPEHGTPPFYYNWDDGHVLQTHSGLSIGNYFVTITDSEGCKVFLAETIEEPTPLILNLNAQDAFCGEMGILTANISGGTPPYQYQWESGAQENTLTNLDAGTYTVTVSDANDCAASSTASIESDPTILDFDVSFIAPSCHGALDGTIEIIMNSGTPPYEFSWNTGSDQSNIDNLGDGNYVFFVNDALGCSDGVTIQLNEPEPLILSIDQNSQDAIATASGGTSPYSFIWDNGIDTPYNLDLVAGAYQVTVFDANDCMTTAIVDITEPLSTATTLETQFSFFPNPANDYLQINVLQEDISSTSFRLFDLKGSILEQGNLHTPTHFINVQHLPVGIYLLQLQQGEQFFIERIVIR